ncbi:anti-anti-sigma factor [Streptomyces sp. 2131.1]|uniref:STAS domain-containing protein n=1 Tax=Streptomyces sp. 2131.1 TaxID=1855346 RepID=UPI000896E0E7|nr:STAS domain-containing protein [Streptomyces sp. 2131.1]SEB68389.1 anti-anti-sigma factor [Streptomyces sp. 2131.1]
MSYGEAVAAARMSGVGASSVHPAPHAAGPGPAQAMVVEYERHGVWVVAAHGSCDLESISRLEGALTTAVRRHPKVVLDTSGITFADSSLLNLLILTHRAGAVRLAAPKPQLQRLLEITGLDAVLYVRATVEEAAAC